MAPREITESDIEPVVAAPSKELPGDEDASTSAASGSRRRHRQHRFKGIVMIRPVNVKDAFGPSVQTVDLIETGSVADDLNAEGNIVGIEILGPRHPD